MGKAAHEMEWSKAQETSVSVDLVKAAKQQLRFLAVVDSIGCLYDGPTLHYAVYRYENCWLPLLAKNTESLVLKEPLVVPLDCEWIWHCHRLNPVSKSIINDDCYLEEAVARYKAFLHLIKRNEERYVKCFCVPTYDIDLIWHSHQLNPLSYCDDLKPIFGKIISHNDHISDSPVDNKHKIGLAQTTKLWEDIFGRKYLITGAMFKSDDKIARCYSIVGFKTCDSQCAEEVTSCAKCFSCGVGFTTYG
ncbi:hypothetical protein CRG98_017146 [Punica granatum]|uniref:Glycine-rich domain-containing protein 1-like n=1 Tax=Punica granatum TaxID=22663 RepID=A0A2I0K1V3_PUNGR|nr:hypothetical protein CRG98_017146 [Punica granatum]